MLASGMPRNIEIKAALDDVARAEETATRLSGASPHVDLLGRVAKT